ncbi:palmitoyl-protein thioesterase ABHD10, mitochondrial-like isoform X2 [Ptychodera flava]|uniref:palmitoyl-protein thioesterase ABHD10, mitochondrial-like isoform X2 n=1 Tax=Ptychodera flava TaxID=63121 RepID=UPI00396A467A
MVKFAHGALNIARRMSSEVTDQPPPKFHKLSNGNSLAYRSTEGSLPGVMFLPGFMSNMNGGKALALEKYCRDSGRSYIRFDYQGCGESLGELLPKDRTFAVWKSDALAVLDELTTGPQVLVGSSMGGAIMLALAMERPDKVECLVGVATAGRFVGDLTYVDTKEGADGQTETITTTIPSDDFIDRANSELLGGKTLPIQCPVRLLHGMKDDTVPYEISMDIARRLESKNVDVILRKESGHRMSTEDDLGLLIKTVDENFNRNAKL